MKTIEQIIAEEKAVAMAQEIEMEPGVKVTRGYLSAQFDRVSDKSNWKNPINAVTEDKNREALAFAVSFFTGSVAMITPIHGGKIRVQAVGYYGAGC